MNMSRPFSHHCGFHWENTRPIEKYMDFYTDLFAHKITVLSPLMSGSRLDCLSLHYPPYPIVSLPTAFLFWD